MTSLTAMVAATISALVPLLVVAGLVLAGFALLTTRRLATALPILLDFLLAAGLVRLGATASWQAIASAAAIVLIRKLASLGIAAARRARAASADHP